jgi:hypothetical protein
MCLIKQKGEAQVAVEDITTYKILDNFRSLYYPFKYEPKRLYSTEMKEDKDWIVADSDAEDALEEEYGEKWRESHKDELMIIGQGYHSCKTIGRAERLKLGYGGICHIYVCTIPKGSLYYEDISDLVVSNQIVIDKILEYGEHKKTSR